MAKSSKGGAYEREVVKLLSLWWTRGERDDVFWRTSGSGARATVRKRKGRDTFGQQGDVQAIDPIGQTFLQLHTIEIKRGYKDATPADFFDCPPTSRPKEFEKWIMQAVLESKSAKTPYWVIISKRDKRVPLMTVPAALALELKSAGAYRFALYPYTRINAVLHDGKKREKVLKLVSFPFASFLAHADPRKWKKLA